jgi:hypothetical protein|tara:strand:+ start:876 stop:1061 length:186 start_codon:yes stop_codon:yes gene_type:complete
MEKPLDKIEPKEITKVALELPQQPLREYTDEQGNEVKLVPIEEALTEILERVRTIDKTLNS